MLNDKLAIQDALKPRSDAWKIGPKITSDNMRNGTGCMVRITRADLLKGCDAPKPLAKPGVYAFGKHRGKTYADVKESDRGYFEWCLESVDGFRAKAKRAGVLDVDDESDTDPLGNDSWGMNE